MPETPLPRRAHLGLRLASTSKPESAGGGLPVRAVEPRSAGERAGAKAGDSLLGIGGEHVTDLPTARRLLKALAPGDPFEIEVLRNGARVTLRDVVQAFPLEVHEGARVVLGEVRVGEHRLRSIAVVPERAGPHPCAYFLPGAHWASEEYPLRPEHPIPALLGELARAGIASFRVERSGMGDSEGPPCTEIGFEAELAGYAAGLEALARASWVSPERVGLFGHSLGAAVAPLIAERARVAAVCVYGPSALRISEGLARATRTDVERDERAGRPLRSPLEPLLELIRLVVAEGLTPDEVYRARTDLIGVAPDRFAGDRAYRRKASFYQELERQDLEGSWRRIAAPVLALHGEHDWICAAEDAERIARLAPRGEHRELAAADHPMSDAPEGAPLSLSKTLRDAVVEWARAALA